MRVNGRQKEVVFLLDIISAKEVLLLGDFTDWQSKPIKLRQRAGSPWQTKVKLPTGRHHYRFLVDGRWHDNANHADRAPNPFGSFDNVIEVS